MHSSDIESGSYIVGTLNFSATIISPYEFHEHSTQDNSLFQFQLNNAFEELALKQIPNFNDENFDWGMSAMDLAWKNRYSPFYRCDCGAGPNGKMMNEQQFLDQWNRQCEQIKNKLISEGIQRLILKGWKLPKQQIAKKLEDQINTCRQFDLLGYKAFIKVIYGIEDIKNLDISSEKYLTERHQHFNKNYLKVQQKMKSTIKMIQQRQYDIFCMQECDKNFINLLREGLHNHIVIEMPDKLSQICESIIILKKSRFPGYTQKKIEQQRQNFLNQFVSRVKNPGNFSKKLQKKISAQTESYLNQQRESQGKQFDQQSLKMRIHRQFFWNDDTCYAVLGPLILISPHISTKKDLNEGQINEIKNTIVKILTYFPEKYFICSGDLNGDFDNQVNLKTVDNMYIKVNVYPTNQDDVTCNKMRTLTQTQKRKALQISFLRKDYIITDLRLSDSVVLMVDGTAVTKQNAPLIPNNRHPFDHFLVQASVQMLGRIESRSPLLKKDRLSKPNTLFDFEKETQGDKKQ